MSENIIKLNYQDKEIYLVKTAHVSKLSAQHVRECIEEVQPDTICIELDKERYNRIINPEQWRDTDIVQVIKNKQVGFLMVNLILSSYQKRAAKSLGALNGGEMITGAKLAQENHTNLVLADRSIRTTFARVWNSFSTFEKIKMLGAIIGSIFVEEEITEDDITALKETDTLTAAISDVGKEFPIVKKIMIDERDQYLSQKIKTAPGKKIVAIIGAAHSIGIQKYINEDFDLEELDRVEKRKSYFKYVIPAAIILLILFTVFKNRDLGIQQIRSWVLWNGGLSALGVLLALGHPLSILTAFVMSPITSLNPLLASGWFAGLVEAMIRKPKVRDFEDLTADTATFAGYWKNRVTRTLMVVIFANLFSTIGTLISGIDIVKKFIESL